MRETHPLRLSLKIPLQKRGARRADADYPFGIDIRNQTAVKIAVGGVLQGKQPVAERFVHFSSDRKARRNGVFCELPLSDIIRKK